MFNRITLDRPNNAAYISLNGVEHLFSSYDVFAKSTKFNFNVVTLSYEPERKIFHVELPGGKVKSGEDLDEITWCAGNIENIITAAHNDGYGNLPPGPSLADIRNMKLLETDWMVTRHRDQLDAKQKTSLTDSQYKTLLNYRSQLRDITSKYSTIDDVVWPILEL